MGGFAYRRHAVQRPDRGGHRDRPGGRATAWRARSPRPAGRGANGSAPALTALEDAVRAGEGHRGPRRAGADLRRCRRQSRAAAGAATRCGSSRRSIAAGVQDALVGVIHDPALAAEAHRPRRGRDASPRASTASGGDEFSKPFAAPATVRRLRDQAGARPARHLRQQHAGPRPVRGADARTASPSWSSPTASNAPIRCSSRRSASTSPPRASWW